MSSTLFKFVSLFYHIYLATIIKIITAPAEYLQGLKVFCEHLSKSVGAFYAL